MKIVLSWPDPKLWPNGRPGNKYQLARLKKAYRHDAEWATIEARMGLGTAPSVLFAGQDIPVKLVVHAKPRGPLPDRDNTVAAVKAALDGIAAQIGVNDRHFAAPTVEFADPRNGTIEVHLG